MQLQSFKAESHCVARTRSALQPAAPRTMRSSTLQVPRTRRAILLTTALAAAALIRRQQSQQHIQQGAREILIGLTLTPTMIFWSEEPLGCVPLGSRVRCLGEYMPSHRPPIPLFSFALPAPRCGSLQPAAAACSSCEPEQREDVQA